MTTTSSAGAIGPDHVCIPHFRFPEISTTPGIGDAANKVDRDCAGSGQDGATLPIVHTVPDGCLIFTVRGNHLEPLVRDGDQVAVDVTDTLPVEDAFYLRRLFSVVDNAFQMDVCAARLLRLGPNRDGTWWLGPRRVSGRPEMCDGPYSEQRFRETLLGRVVAIVVGRAPQPLPKDPKPDLHWQSGAFVWVEL